MTSKLRPQFINHVLENRKFVVINKTETTFCNTAHKQKIKEKFRISGNSNITIKMNEWTKFKQMFEG